VLLRMYIGCYMLRAVVKDVLGPKPFVYALSLLHMGNFEATAVRGLCRTGAMNLWIAFQDALRHRDE